MARSGSQAGCGESVRRVTSHLVMSQNSLRSQEARGTRNSAYDAGKLRKCTQYASNQEE